MSDQPQQAARQSPRPDSDPYTQTGDLRSYVAIVRRRKWSLIIVVAITVAAAAFFSYRQVPMYRATSTVLVKPLNPNQILQGYTYNFSVSMATLYSRWRAA